MRKQTLFIATPGKAEKDMLLTMKDEMTLALREFFGMQLTFETGGKAEMLAKAGNPVVIKPEIVEDVVKPKQERSELELALIEQLGAQEV